ncbi:hypothetical protein GCM10009773_17610 [Williamsia serinedens]
MRVVADTRQDRRTVDAEDRPGERITEHDPAVEVLVQGAVTRRPERRAARLSISHGCQGRPPTALAD